MRRLFTRQFWRWAPPIGLAAWAVNVYQVATRYSIPAFGDVEPYIADYWLTVLRHLPVGVALLCVWGISWLRLRMTTSKNDRIIGKVSHRRRGAVRSAE